MQQQILGLITPMTAAIFVAVFMILWFRARLGNYVLAFAAAYFFFAIGFSVNLLIDPEAWFICLLTQLTYSAAGACLVWGATTRMRQRVSLAMLGSIYLLSAGMLAVALFQVASGDLRLHIVNAGYAVMFLVGALVMMQGQRRSIFDRLIMLWFALSAAQLLLQPMIMILIENGAQSAIAMKGIYDSMMSLAVTAQALVIAVTLVGACVFDQIEAVRRQADIDELTGLRTRRAFEHDVVHMLEKAKHEMVPVALVVADIDHFKAVNDVWGHQAGDRAIAQFGEVIAGTIRETDIAGRIGGEEFCILAWQCDEDAAMIMAERIRRVFTETIIDGLPADHRLTASFGVAGRHETEGYGKLFARTDTALYEAKDGGRNRCARSGQTKRRAVVTPIGSAVRARRELLG